MNDLYLACAVVAAIAAGLFLGTRLLIRRMPNMACDLLALAVIVALFYYIAFVWYDIGLVRWLPVSSLIVLSNWLPLLAAVLAAVVWRRMQFSPPRQLVYTGALCLSAGYALVHPLLGNPPECGDRWDQLGSCLQTTNITCSPACAATLLSLHGIEANEREMARLCLTRNGTSWQGLYRGLKLKTAGTPWDVEVRQCSAQELRELTGQPMILSVGLESGSTVDGEFSEEFGWVPGVNHSVMLLGFSPQGNAVIADPTQEQCREHWDRETFETLWRGYAFRLVERNK